jgi:gliding motility-associated-like protein
LALLLVFSIFDQVFIQHSRLVEIRSYPAEKKITGILSSQNFMMPVFVLSMLFFSSGVFAQCSFIASDTLICKGNSVVFQTLSSAYRYAWTSGTGNTDNRQTAVFHYDTFGVFTATLKMYDINDQLLCEGFQKIHVFDQPLADIDLPDTLLICGIGEYCFRNTSRPGKTGAPVIASLWLFGDGDTSSKMNPCHTYQEQGEYMLYLNVKDSNACEAIKEKKTYIKLLPSMEPDFKTNYIDSCPVTYVTFINLSDTLNKNIISYIWDYDDGQSDTNKQWTNFRHKYEKDGLFTPSLTLINAYGCIERVKCEQCAGNIIFDFNISRSPEVQCWEDNRVYFNQKPLERYFVNFYWDFGDPASGTTNINGANWNPEHIYSGPGIYDVRLRVVARNCIRDTTICSFVKIKGPLARILLPNISNNCLRTKAMSPDILAKANSTCLNPNADPLEYTLILKTHPYLVGKTPLYCNADTQLISLHIRKCGVDSVITLGPPTSYVDIYDTLVIGKYKYYPGDPLPSQEFYFPPSGVCNDQTMHDTDLIVLHCSGPNYVRFTNNSQKYRLYNAIDNSPPYHGASLDLCKNPSYPWASDSLQHLWNFGDSYAKNCTSTRQNPDIKCNYSSEIQPWHLYEHDGCYTAILSVFDPETACSSGDTIKIVMEPPDAAWDRSKIDYLNYYSQKLVSDRKGLVLEGIPCKNQKLFFNIDETLPSCMKEDWGIIFDSAQDCYSTCIDTTFLDINGDGISDTQIHRFDSCIWLDKLTYYMIYPRGYYYQSKGCKTLGLWIKSGDCYDTFWYHNYIYIPELDPAFSVLEKDSLYPINDSLTAYCSPFSPIILKARHEYQEAITKYSFEISRTKGLVGAAPFTKITGAPLATYDTAYTLCEKNKFITDPVSGEKTYLYCFKYPPFACDDDPLGEKELDHYLQDYVITDTHYLLSLADTLWLMDSLIDPGLYNIKGVISNIYGCTDAANAYIELGFFADFWASDSIICKHDSVCFTDSIAYFRNRPEKPDYWEWDLDGDGIFETKKVHNPCFTYDTPGVYSISLRVIDTLNCIQEQIITRNHYISVGGVIADFDTSNSPDICAPEIVGFRNKSILLNPYYYIYDSSGNITDSVEVDNISAYVWDFGDNKGIHSRSFLEDPKHPYTLNGVYDVMLIVKSAQGCVDTLMREEYIRIEGPQPEFLQLDSLICVNDSIRVIDKSKDLSLWIWELGDKTQVSGVFNYQDTVYLTYRTPGLYKLGLIGSDSVYNVFLGTKYKCTSIYPDARDPFADTFFVRVLPDAPLSFHGDSVLCSGETAIFTNISDSAYQILYWDFGDGSVDSSFLGQSVFHSYNLPDSIFHDTFLVSFSGGGARCPMPPMNRKVMVSSTLARVEVKDKFSDPPVFCFENNSLNGYFYSWTFERGNPPGIQTMDTLMQCSDFYADTGVFEVCLISVNRQACRDTACVLVYNSYDIGVYIPNIFTPANADGQNDSFFVLTKNAEKYHLQVFNRWGEMVFESYNPHYLWDGTLMNSGEHCPASTYYYVFKYKFRHYPEIVKSGTVTLIREE